jgi:hypothetical protein
MTRMILQVTTLHLPHRHHRQRHPRRPNLKLIQVEKKWRPLDIFTWGVTNSPRLIGWNDEDFRKIVEEHRRQRLKDPSIPNVEETGFGLMGYFGQCSQGGSL